MADFEEARRLALALPEAEEDTSEALLASEPEVFTLTDHYRAYPMVLVHLEAIGLEELGEVLTDAWLHAAPERLRRAQRVMTALLRPEVRRRSGH